MVMEIQLSTAKKHSAMPTILFTLLVLIIAGGFTIAYLAPRFAGEGAIRISKIRTWFLNPAAHPEWQVNAGDRCGDAPMLIPTTGFIGVGWGDGRRPGFNHTGYDIFSPDGAENITPVVAAYDGFLTREANWRSAVIIRHPDFPNFSGAPPGLPGSQIWTYYTHMASRDGTLSYIEPAFPAGTYEVFVQAGTLLGYQGTWSGNPSNPTGLHLHFSVVRTSFAGGYENETVIANTFDPAPFLGLSADQNGIINCRNG